MKHPQCILLSTFFICPSFLILYTAHYDIYHTKKMIVLAFFLSRRPLNLGTGPRSVKSNLWDTVYIPS